MVVRTTKRKVVKKRSTVGRTTTGTWGWPWSKKKKKKKEFTKGRRAFFDPGHPGRHGRKTMREKGYAYKKIKGKGWWIPI